MRISNIAGNAPGSYKFTNNAIGVNQDEQIKSLQKQIEIVQKQLHSLSGNKSMSPEEIMEKRKELQQQIQDLIRQISRRKMEIQKEKHETSKTENQKTRQVNTAKEDYAAIDTGTMQELISLDSTMKQINTVQSIKIAMEGRVRVLKREIETDKGRGCSTEEKEAELAELNDRINAISNDIMYIISGINTRIKESGKATDIQGGTENKQGGEVSEDTASTEANQISLTASFSYTII